MTASAGQAYRFPLHQLFLLAVLIATAFYQTRWLPTVQEAPFGCDDFGYQRQAALFRENGLAGFDTRLETPNSRRLIEVAKATGEDSRHWYQAIAPHCHHYRAETDKVILQYPPGTGMLMAPFPEDVERRWFRFVCAFAAAAAFALLLARSARVADGLVVLGGATLVLISFKVGTDSAYAGITLSVICGLLLAPALRQGSFLLPALLGLAAGFSSTIRITNLLIVVVVGAVLLVRLVRRRTGQDAAAILAFSAGSLAGLTPVLWANFVNAGSVFSTTYSEIDASTPRIDLDQLARGIEFYFRDNENGLALTWSLIIGLAALLAQWRSVAVRVAAAVMAMSLVYLVPKEILVPYYLLPAAGFLITVSVASMIDRPEPAPLRAWPTVSVLAFPASVAAAAIVGLGVIAFPSQRLVPNPAVQEQFKRDPIVWGDVYGSAVVARYRTYSAKLVATSPEIQDALVLGVHDAGVEQFFVADTDSMAAVVDRLRTRWSLLPAGDVFGKPLYRLTGRSGPE